MKENYVPVVDPKKVKELEVMKIKHPHKNCVLDDIYAFHKKSYEIGDNKLFQADKTTIDRKTRGEEYFK